MPSLRPGKPPLLRAPSGGAWTQASEKLIGHTLADRYRLERPIGSGGMGTVYLAQHVVIRKPVAVKVLAPEYGKKESEVERFLGEARAASKIRHEHVVDITDFGTTRDGLVFLVMEYLEGEDLATTLDREGPLGWRRAAAIVLQIAAALEAAHAQGIVHRDMKPENCFRIRRGDDRDFIKVLDFGIAKVIDETDVERPSSSGSGLIGTPEYVAPELIRGQRPDARVDIYAVGVIFYRLLTGRVPFVADSFMATLTAHLTEPPRPPSEVVPAQQIPGEVEAVVLRALAKEPDERQATIAEFSAALREAVAQHEVPAAIGMMAGESAARGGVHPRVVLAVVVALILVFAAVLWYVVQELQTKDQVRVAQVEPPAAVATPVVTPGVVVPAPAEAKADEPPPVEVGADAPPTVEAKAEDPPVAAPVAAPASERKASNEPRSRPPPQGLSADDFAAGMTRIAPRVKLECSRYALRKMTVTIAAVVGPDGEVTSAEPTGAQAGSSLGNCVARVVKTAVLESSRAKSSHRHTFTM